MPKPQSVLKSHLVVKANIDALLKRDRLTRKDLALWCHKTESWISKIFGSPLRAMPEQYFDRIADMFGVETYELLRPGGADGTERRKVNRRAGVERRIGWQQRLLEELRPGIERARRTMPSYAHDSLSPEAAAKLKVLDADYEARVSRLIAADARRQAARSRAKESRAPVHRRAHRGPDVEKA